MGREEIISAAEAQRIMKIVNANFKSQVLKMGSDPQFVVEYLPTGLLPIDILLEGGIPRGRFITVIGDFSTLKSYIGMRAIAMTQAAGGTAALLDTEHGYDPKWAEACGVDTKSLIMPPDLPSGERAVDVCEALIREQVDFICFDSVAASLPQAERAKKLENETRQMARLASLMSVAMRKLNTANSRTAVMWINQFRMNVGVTFGNPEVATGGRALPYTSSYIMEIRKTTKEKSSRKVFNGVSDVDSSLVVGQHYKAILTKSKLSKPFGEALFYWDLNRGAIDEDMYLFAQAVEHGLVKKTGKSLWSVTGSRMKPINGREKFLNNLRTDAALKKTLLDKVYQANELVPPAIYLGPARPVRRKALPVKESKQLVGARKSTQGRALVGSKPMLLPKKSSSSSKTR